MATPLVTVKSMFIVFYTYLLASMISSSFKSIAIAAWEESFNMKIKVRETSYHLTIKQVSLGCCVHHSPSCHGNESSEEGNVFIKQAWKQGSPDCLVLGLKASDELKHVCEAGGFIPLNDGCQFNIFMKEISQSMYYVLKCQCHSDPLTTSKPKPSKGEGMLPLYLGGGAVIAVALLCLVCSVYCMVNKNNRVRVYFKHKFNTWCRCLCRQRSHDEYAPISIETHDPSPTEDNQLLVGPQRPQQSDQIPILGPSRLTAPAKSCIKQRSESVSPNARNVDFKETVDVCNNGEILRDSQPVNFARKKTLMPKGTPAARRKSSSNEGARSMMYRLVRVGQRSTGTSSLGAEGGAQGYTLSSAAEPSLAENDGQQSSYSASAELDSDVAGACGSQILLSPPSGVSPIQEEDDSSESCESSTLL